MNDKSKDAGTEKEVATTDLAVYDGLKKTQEDGIDVHIKDPAGHDLGMVIRVAGPDSERQKKAVQKLQDERLQSEDVMPMTAEEIARRQVRGLAMSVIGWSKTIVGGRELKYSEENAVELFNRFPWIREQVEAKAGKRAAFLKLSKQDAAPLSDAG